MATESIYLRSPESKLEHSLDYDMETREVLELRSWIYSAHCNDAEWRAATLDMMKTILMFKGGDSAYSLVKVNMNGKALTAFLSTEDYFGNHMRLDDVVKWFENRYPNCPTDWTIF